MEVQIQLSLLTKFHFNSYIVHSFPSGLFALIIITFLFQNILYATLKFFIFIIIIFLAFLVVSFALGWTRCLKLPGFWSWVTVKCLRVCAH